MPHPDVSDASVTADKPADQQPASDGAADAASNHAASEHTHRSGETPHPAVTGRQPSTTSEVPEDRYRPSRKLAEWVRAVHGWCAHPGCSRPAWESDLDHRTPYRTRCSINDGSSPL